VKTSPYPLRQGKVVWTYVNLRDGPGINYKIIGKIYQGNAFETLEEKRGWLRVRLENRTEGWVSKSATSEGIKTPKSPTRPAPEPSPPEQQTPPMPTGPM